MQRLLRPGAASATILALLWAVPAGADSTVHGLATPSTSPLPAGSCLYVDQGPGTDTKLCANHLSAFLRPQVTKTSSYSVLPADNFSDFDNAGAAGAETFTLPTWSAGLTYCFAQEAASTITIQAASGNFITEFGASSASGGTAASTAQYSMLCVVAKTSAIWQIDRHVGGWTLT